MMHRESVQSTTRRPEGAFRRFRAGTLSAGLSPVV